ncbi:MAG: outer membrane beta-barrel protein [Bacteroidales bacterium]|nr:outer membrane beta-barrel protein [Bacteroidales bacterium]
MKRVILILIVVFAFNVNSLLAQRFGVKGGFNLTNLKIENSDYSPKLGFHFGPVAEFHFGNIFGLETGMLLTTKGGKEKFATTENKINLTYLEFPINARAGYDFGDYRVYGLFGPYIGVAIGGKYKTTFDGVTTSTKVDWGSDAGLKRFDAGITIGACTAVKIFEVGFSYSHGLVNISSWHNTKNRVFSVFMAYKFGKNPFKR